jgi:hypothetical protein
MVKHMQVQLLVQTSLLQLVLWTQLCMARWQQLLPRRSRANSSVVVVASYLLLLPLLQPHAICVLYACVTESTHHAGLALILPAAQAGADGFDSRVYLANRLENKTNMSESKTRNYSGGHCVCVTACVTSNAGTKPNSSSMYFRSTLARTCELLAAMMWVCVAAVQLCEGLVPTRPCTAAVAALLPMMLAADRTKSNQA